MRKNSMVLAYVFINVKRGGELSAEKLKSLKGVMDMSLVYGEYDIIMKVNKESMEDLQNFLVKELRPLGFIEKTSTMIVVQK